MYIVKSSDFLSGCQYDFRRAYSMVDITSMNGFNSANWNRIKGTLADISIPGYLASLVESYLSDRTPWYRTDKNEAGVPQDSAVLRILCCGVGLVAICGWGFF